MLNYAMHALELGFCVMPAMEDGSKQPLGNSQSDRRWKQFQATLPTPEKIQEWYAGKLNNIGFICGAVSGNLEVMDFDDADCYHEFKGAAASCGMGDLVASIEAGYLEHSPKGVHWLYRCEEIVGNLKLASREKTPEERTHERDKVQVMIETRGEGGFIIAAPSSGAVNPKGEYRLISGSLETVPTLSAKERRELHHLALSFDRMPKTIEYAEINDRSTDSDGLRPGDDFAERTTWDQILEPHGWKRCFARGDETFWTRPGKEYGISATTNYAGSGFFYCFSSSTEFEQNRGFSKFAVHTYLNHNGDFEASASGLSREGFGSKPEDRFEETRPLKIKQQPKGSTDRDKPVDPEKIPDAFMDIPGFVNDMQGWINSCAVRRQPIFAFAASLAFAGLLMGRKVQTHTGLRTNLMIIALGDSASGKNEPRNCIRRALVDSDNKHLIGAETIGSESGLLDELANNGGQAIYQLDEIGHALGAMTSKKAQGYLAAIIPTLMKLQSTAGHTWIGKSLKKSKDGDGRTDIEDPIVVVYGTSVPDKYYNAIDHSNIEDGFVPRFLTFQTNTPFPRMSYTRTTGPTPDTILGWIEKWTHQTKGRYIPRPSAHGDARVVRHTEKTMEYMRRFENIVQDAYLKYREDKLHAIWGRAQATAEQLALLFTCSADPDALFLDEQATAKACGLARYLCEQQMQRLGNNVSSSDYENDLKRIRRAIELSGSKGIVHTKLLQNNTGMPGRRFAEIISQLTESTEVTLVRGKVGSSRKPSKIYYSTNFVEVQGDDSGAN